MIFKHFFKYMFSYNYRKTELVKKLVETMEKSHLDELCLGSIVLKRDAQRTAWILTLIEEYKNKKDSDKGEDKRIETILGLNK